MAKRSILIYPDPLLKQKAAPVTTFGKDLERLLNDLAETMYSEQGIGLAATQVGEMVRAVVVDVSDNGTNLIHLVNPTIITRNGATSMEEGCLSIPGYREYVDRAQQVVVRAFDKKGSPFEIPAEDLFAVCIQHEIDHLDGVLFVDRISRLKRELFLKWAKKNLLPTQEKD